MKSMTLSELAVIAKQIGGIISCSMGLITFLTLAIKPLRKIAAKTISHMAKESEFESVLKELRKDIAEIKEENTKQSLEIEQIRTSNRVTLGNAIKQIYYQYCDQKSLPIHEKQAIDTLMPAYRAVDGDNYVDDIYDEMKSWETLI